MKFSSTLHFKLRENDTFYFWNILFSAFFLDLLYTNLWSLKNNSKLRV